MSQSRPTPIRASLDRLEARENPTQLLTESFDTVAAPFLPAGWAHWSNGGGQQFITSRLQSASGPNSLASLGGWTTEARAWPTDTFPADAGGAVEVRGDTVAPVELITRGVGLNTASPSYLAAVTTSGGGVRLVQVTNGAETVLGTVSPVTRAGNTWLRVTLQPVGGTASVTVQRADSGQYLSAAGGWQAAATAAVQATVAPRTQPGQVGVGRDAGGSGMTYLDDFVVLAPPGVTEPFDTTPPGGLPDGWQQWGSDRPTPAAVGTERSLSPASALAVSGGSLTRARAWPSTALPANVSASVSVYADSLIPAGVLVRGSNLNTTTPTFYSLTTSRGLTVQLNRVENGVETPLGSLRSEGYVSGRWVKLTLVAEGDRLRGMVFRTDTGQWLGSDGKWRATPETAFDVTDTGIRTGGLVGVERTRLAFGSIWFDDFEARVATATPGPVVRVTASQPGTTFQNTVTFTATATPADVARIDFTLNGQLRASQPVSPAVWELDTTTLANGPYTLQVRAVDRAGNATTETFEFEVRNDGSGDDPTRPAGVRKYDHIRLAQLAYAGNPLGQYERDLAKNSLDLIIPNVAYLNALEAATADTPKVIYTNVSNVYETLLTDLLEYFDRTGTARESAFFHVSVPTTFSGGSQSSVPVNQFWGVYRGLASGGSSLVNLTGEARGTRPAGVEFAGPGQAVSIGWTDRFREINVTLNRAASGWAGRFEYVAEVNPDGTPKTWKTLTLLADGTAGFTRNGQLTFDPPTDWKAAKLSGTGQHLYYVRAVTTAGTGPNARTLLGRDYVGANGQLVGIIPAFDATADKDGDGYLNDAEYATRLAGFNARFVHESRLFYPKYGQMRFVTNPAATGVHQWAADYHVRMLAAHPHADGFFVDNSNGKLPFPGVSVLESVATYTDDSAALVGTVTRAIPGKWVVANTVGSRAEGNPVAAQATAAFEEFLLRPNEVNWSGLLDVADLVNQRLNADSPSPYVILDSRAGSGSVSSERTRMGTLAYYYLLADPDDTFLMFFGGDSPAAAWDKVFVPAATVNVGRPTGAMSVVASGVDPTNDRLTYRVFGRDYGNAKVLFKPRSYALGVGTGTTDDATATTHDLGGNYRVLNSDGTLGPVVTQVTLRNGEGVVLMKA